MHCRVRYLLDFDLKIRSGQVWNVSNPFLRFPTWFRKNKWCLPNFGKLSWLVNKCIFHLALVFGLKTTLTGRKLCVICLYNRFSNTFEEFQKNNLNQNYQIAFNITSNKKSQVLVRIISLICLFRPF